MSFSLDECFKLYQTKLGELVKNTRTPIGQLIDKLKIVMMPKINYFQYNKGNNSKDYIFIKRNQAQNTLLRSDTEINMTNSQTQILIPPSKNCLANYHSAHAALQSTMKLPKPCQLPTSESSETEPDIFSGEDCSIAEEFNDDEDHISTDLAKREIEKTYKFPKLSNTPRVKNHNQGLSFLFDRKRSMTYMSTINTKGLFLRGKHGIQKEPFIERTQNTKQIQVPLQTIAEKVKTQKARIPPSMPCYERMRTNSIDSGIGSFITKIGQKENMCGMSLATPRKAIKCSLPTRPIIKAAKTMKNIHTNGPLEKQLKEKFSLLLNKGSHKFSNTAQAQPKILIKKECSIDISHDGSEVLGDELSTIRTNRLKQITNRIVNPI